MSVHNVCLKLAATVCISVFLISCQPQSQSTTVEFRVPVTVAEVGMATVEDVIVTTGTVRAAETITLTVKTDGLLQIATGKNGKLAEGDHVKAGDLIANITGEDARLATNMRVAEKKLEVARENLVASSLLFKDKLVSVDRHGRDKTAFEDAKHAYEISLHSENRNKIITPISGVILQLARNNGQLMANGQLVMPGQTIAQIAPMDPLVADVDLVGKDIARVQVGMVARSAYHAWQDRRFAGRVLRLSPTINETTRAMRAEVEINNEAGLLRPGMFVKVSLIAQKRENVLVVPRRSLTQRGGRRVVFVVNGQRAEQREVELGLGDDEFVEIRKGLEVGDRVVVLGLQTLSDQMPIRVTGS
jgi:membrane fusion protein (multidrug efflux system)